MTLFITLLLNAACSPQIPGKKTAREMKFMTHGRHVDCKTDLEAKKEASSSSEDGTEGAICRQSFPRAGRLAVRIDNGFSMSK